MRLLHLGDLGELTLTEDLLDNIPPYAILSHTWGALGDEVVLQDIREGYFAHKPGGYRKVLFCGRQARRDGLEYFWVDTCCIDKTSSAELTEAINSMYRWYQNAAKCYVYLEDVSVNTSSAAGEGRPGYAAGRNYAGRGLQLQGLACNIHERLNEQASDNENLTPAQPKDSSWQPAFRNSRWFTRGWTLQEFLASPIVEFYSSDGCRVGDKQSLKPIIQEITGIPLPAFQKGWQSAIPVHERIAWSYSRETTRPEDKVYSLLGIVGVSMPVVYGEGEEEAFVRLCKEMIQRYDKYKEVVNSNAESMGESPMMYASKGGHEAITRILLDAKVDAETTDGNGDSPLLLAARGGHEAVVRLLIGKGANLKRKNKQGRSALLYAAQKGHEGVVRLLLHKGADIESKDNKGETAMSIAARKGQEAVLRVLLDKKKTLIESKCRSYTLLMLAASNGHGAVVRLLLDRGASIDATDRSGHLALDHAVKGGHEDIAELLRLSRQSRGAAGRKGQGKEAGHKSQSKEAGHKSQSKDTGRKGQSKEPGRSRFQSVFRLFD
ncbi:HET-domain-containing protein [Apiospora arundinis]